VTERKSSAPLEAGPSIANRVIGFKVIPGSELAENSDNYKVHPRAQRGAMSGLLEQVGIAGALVAYRSERNVGALTLLDGHMRRDLYPGSDWPVLITDLTDEEADLVLATFDTVGEEAEVQPGDQLDRLIDRAAGVARSEDVKRLLEKHRENAKIAQLMARARQQLEEHREEDQEANKKMRAGFGSARQRVRAVLWVDEIDVFERALRATGKVNRGDALIAVCRRYLGLEDPGDGAEGP
jgi:hypothetical protein